MIAPLCALPGTDVQPAKSSQTNWRKLSNLHHLNTAIFIPLCLYQPKETWIPRRTARLHLKSTHSQNASFEAFCTIRHRLAWVTHTRPECLAGVTILSQSTTVSVQTEDVQVTTNGIKHLKKYPSLRLRYEQLNKQLIATIVYSDGSFSGNKDEYSQVRFMIFIKDKRKKASLIDFSTMKCRIIVPSVLEAETFGLSDACDANIFVKHDLE